jgi:hypothetical protein
MYEDWVEKVWKLPRYFTYHTPNYLGKTKNEVGKL